MRLYDKYKLFLDICTILKLRFLTKINFTLNIKTKLHLPVVTTKKPYKLTQSQTININPIYLDNISIFLYTILNYLDNLKYIINTEIV